MDLPLMVLLKTSVSFLSAFLAIWVWARVREEGWLFLVLGSLMHFFGFLLQVLSLLGIFTFSGGKGGAIPVWYGILQLIPYLCYSLGFAFFLYRNRHY